MAMAAETVAKRLENLRTAVADGEAAVEKTQERLEKLQAKLQSDRDDLAFWSTHPLAPAESNGA